MGELPDRPLSEREREEPEEPTGATLFDGVLVVARPERLERCCHALDRLPGVEVHHREPRTGRIVTVVESADPGELRETLRRMRSLPDALLAAVVYHYVDSGDGAEAEGRAVR